MNILHFYFLHFSSFAILLTCSILCPLPCTNALPWTHIGTHQTSQTKCRRTSLRSQKPEGLPVTDCLSSEVVATELAFHRQGICPMVFLDFNIPLPF